jgi:hypothetical protein
MVFSHLLICFRKTHSLVTLDLDQVRLSRVRGRARGEITRESLSEKTDLAHLQARQIYRPVFPLVTRHEIAIIYASCNKAEITKYLVSKYIACRLNDEYVLRRLLI